MTAPFGTRLRASRESLGWTVADLAAKSGVGADTIRRIEARGEIASITLGRYLAIVDAFRREGFDVEAVEAVGVAGTVARPPGRAPLDRLLADIDDDSGYPDVGARRDRLRLDRLERIVADLIRHLQAQEHPR